MSDSSLDALKQQVDTLSVQIEKLTAQLAAQAGSLNRVSELAEGVAGRVLRLEGGTIAGDTCRLGGRVALHREPAAAGSGSSTLVLGSSDFQNGLAIDGALAVRGRIDGGDILDVTAPQVRLHASDLILDGRTGNNARALVDMGDQLVINFNGNYDSGVKIHSSLDVLGLAVEGTLAVNGPIVGSGDLDVTAGQVRFHASDLILDGRTGNTARALVDLGSRLVINFNGDYSDGVTISGSLDLDGPLSVGSNASFARRILMRNGSGEDHTVFSVEGSQLKIIGFVGIDSVSIHGSLEVTRPVSAPQFIPSGGDVAEHFAARDGVVAVPGMVMVVDDFGRLTLSTAAHDHRLVGVVAGAGGLGTGLLMKPQEGGVPIALAGSVFCNCDADYGSIRPGDLLTTSETRGHARRTDPEDAKPGTIIGKALAALGEGVGQIPVLVSTS